MIDFAKVMLLAVIQGITEFLPISSSGHLVIAEHFLRLKAPGALLEVLLHAGTLVSVLVYYRKSLTSLATGCFRSQRPAWMTVMALVIGSIPAIIVFLSVGHTIESTFDNPRLVFGFECVTGLVLLSTLLIRNKPPVPITGVRAFFIGVAQAIALLPGISRSGMTIVSASHMGIAAEESVVFSLLLSIPTLFGAVILKGISLWRHGCATVPLFDIACGVIVSAVVGYFSIGILTKIAVKGRLWILGVYCIVAGIAGLLLIKN